MIKRLGLLLALLYVQTLAATAETTRCYLPGREDRVTCLNLQVPLDWRAPQGQKIGIFAAVIPALSRAEARDPLFLLPGGPGQSGDGLLDLVPTAFRIINQSRDLVLIYPRGTHRSTALACAASTNIWPSDAEIRAQIAACAAAQKIDPRFFTSREIVQDMNALRRALGYQQINIWGGSFGTRLAAHFAKAYPAETRSLILDGATSITESILLSSPQSMEQALRSISNACKDDKSCAAQIPNLYQNVHALVSRLNNTPQIVALSDPATLQTRTIKLDGRMLAMAIRLALYAPQSRAIVPPLIKAALAGNYQPFAAFTAGMDVHDEALSLGAHLSAMCAEDVSAVTLPQMQIASRGTLLGVAEYQSYQQQCTLWPHQKLSATDSSGQMPDTPVLILSGALDPVTPPALGHKVAALFKRHRHIIIPASGHISSGFACAPSLLATFLHDLTPTKLDVKCLMRALPPAPLSSANG